MSETTRYEIVTFRPNRVDAERIERLQEETDLPKAELLSRGLELLEERLRMLESARNDGARVKVTLAEAL